MAKQKVQSFFLYHINCYQLKSDMEVILTVIYTT